MTSEETELLITQWGSDPAPTVLADPWERRSDSFGQERAIQAALKNRPDLGWALAERIANTRRLCPLLKRPEYRWIRAAVYYLTDEVKATRHLNEVNVIGQALALSKSRAELPVIKAALMTREATAPIVAFAFNFQQNVIKAYVDLFFNVLDRKGDVIFLQKIMGLGKNDPLFVSKSSLLTEEEFLLAAGYEGTITDVLRIAGMARGDEDESDDELMKQLKRKVLKAGIKALEAPRALKQPLPALASQVIDIVKKAQIEQPASTEDTFPGDFGSMARDVLKSDAAYLKKRIEENLNPSA